MILRALALLLALPTVASAQVPVTGAGKATPTVAGGPVAFTSPIIAQGTGTAAPATGTTVNYTGLVGAGGAAVWNATLTARQFPIPIAGKFSGLEVNAPSISGAWTGSIQMTLNIGGSIVGAPSCTLSASPAQCFDHATVSGSVSPGALVAIESNPSSPTYTNTTAAPWQISVAFKGDNPQEGLVLLGYAYGNSSTTVINYAGVSNLWSVTESLVSVVMPAAGKLDQFYAHVTGAMGVGAGYQFTVFKNGQAAALVAGNGSTTCWNTTQDCSDLNTGHAVNVVAGDTISVASCPSNTATCPAGAAPTARGASFGLRWVPTVASQALVLESPGAVPPTNASTTRYSLASGSGNTWDAAVTNQINVLPYTSLNQTYGNLTVAYCGSASASSARAVSLSDTGGTGLGPTVSTGAVVACPSVGTGFSSGAGTLAQDATHTYAAGGPTTDYTTFILKQVTGTAPAAITLFKASMTVVVQ